MITASDFILCALRKKGYKSITNFAEKNGIKHRNLAYCFSKNMWTKQMLIKVGNALNMDLTRFENAKLGQRRDVFDVDNESEEI